MSIHNHDFVKSTPRSSPNKNERNHMMEQEKMDNCTGSNVDMYVPSSSIDYGEATMFPGYQTPTKTFRSNNIHSSFTSASPILSGRTNYTGIGIQSSPNTHKRKSRSDNGRVENKRFIREIANGLDKMAIKVRSPPPSPQLEKNWMHQFYGNNPNNSNAHNNQPQFRYNTIPSSTPIANNMNSGSSSSNNNNNSSSNNSIGSDSNKKNNNIVNCNNNFGDNNNNNMKNRKEIVQLRHLTVVQNSSNNSSTLVPGAVVNRKLFNRQNHHRNGMKQKTNRLSSSRNSKVNGSCNNNVDNNYSMNYQADREDSVDTIDGSPIKIPMGIVPKRIVQLRDEDTIFKTLFEHDIRCRSILNSMNKFG